MCQVYVSLFSASATRETAILNAFLSAGAVHGVASACHDGIVDGCYCGDKTVERVGRVTYLYSCNDDIEFAIENMREFCGVDDSVEERDLVDKWNNELGYNVSYSIPLPSFIPLSLSFPQAFSFIHSLVYNLQTYTLLL